MFSYDYIICAFNLSGKFVFIIKFWIFSETLYIELRLLDSSPFNVSSILFFIFVFSRKLSKTSLDTQKPFDTGKLLLIFTPHHTIHKLYINILLALGCSILKKFN